jgi:hypothetical protein
MSRFLGARTSDYDTSMNDAVRIKLHGTYRTPRFRIGATVECAVRGELTIKGVTDARIPWPIGNSRRGARSLVVYGDLARAVQRESSSAICYWFGVRDWMVTKWRKALGVPERNYGTRKLWEAALANGSYVKGIKAATAKARDHLRRARIAAVQRGKRRPDTVIAKIRGAHLGAKRNAITRQRMSEAWKRRGKPKPAGGPWRSWEDDLVRTQPVAEVVRWTGRTCSAVRWRRRLLSGTLHPPVA